jgi:flagellar biosynthesis/type III secretory pathway protein FliH
MREGLKMLWSEKYRNEFVDGYDEGYAEGYAEGFARGMELAYRLASDGRGNELFEAEGNPEKLRSLLEEYGLSQAKHGDAVRKSAV